MSKLHPSYSANEDCLYVLKYLPEDAGIKSISPLLCPIWLAKGYTPESLVFNTKSPVILRDLGLWGVLEGQLHYKCRPKPEEMKGGTWVLPVKKKSPNTLKVAYLSGHAKAYHPGWDIHESAKRVFAGYDKEEPAPFLFALDVSETLKKPFGLKSVSSLKLKLR